MKFFVDAADVKEIRGLNDLGLLDGVTTKSVANPQCAAEGVCQASIDRKEGWGRSRPKTGEEIG